MKLHFQASFSMVDEGGLELAIVETGGNTFDVSVTTGEWFLSEDGAGASGDFEDLVTDIGSLVDEVQSQLNAGTGGGGAYLVAFNEPTRRVIITLVGSSVTAVSITPTTGGGLLGITGVLSGALTHSGQRVPDFWIDSDVGFWSEWSGEYEGGEEVAFDVEAHDGTPGGDAKDDAAMYVDFELPTEPVAKVGNYPRLIASSQPWTWKDFWKHSRNTWIFAMRDDDEVYYLLLRAEGAKFRPRARGDNYIAHWDLRFQTRVLARGS